jgi:phosphatidate phosphatase LPIN
VRFGKLRVLRVGEKRVTLTMPNNLPEPHIAPFSMKVSDTGEAFFVLETDGEVPADLLTSPVISATDVRILINAPLWWRYSCARS